MDLFALHELNSIYDILSCGVFFLSFSAFNVLGRVAIVERGKFATSSWIYYVLYALHDIGFYTGEFFFAWKSRFSEQKPKNSLLKPLDNLVKSISLDTIWATSSSSQISNIVNIYLTIAITLDILICTVRCKHCVSNVTIIAASLYEIAFSPNASHIFIKQLNVVCRMPLAEIQSKITHFLVELLWFIAFKSFSFNPFDNLRLSEIAYISQIEFEHGTVVLWIEYIACGRLIVPPSLQWLELEDSARILNDLTFLFPIIAHNSRKRKNSVIFTSQWHVSRFKESIGLADAFPSWLNGLQCTTEEPGGRGDRYSEAFDSARRCNEIRSIFNITSKSMVFYF